MTDIPDPAPTPDPADKTLRDVVAENRSRFLWFGILMIVVGIIAILFPLLASITAKFMVGAFLLVTGAAALWHAFQAKSWKPGLLSGFIGLLHLVAGVYLLIAPLTGLIGLTALMAFVFGTQGVAELILAWQHRPGHGNEGPGWAWMGLSGLVSLVLGLLLFLGLPGTALWALGLVLGVNFLSSGISFVALSRAV